MKQIKLRIIEKNALEFNLQELDLLHILSLSIYEVAQIGETLASYNINTLHINLDGDEDYISIHQWGIIFYLLEFTEITALKLSNVDLSMLDCDELTSIWESIATQTSINALELINVDFWDFAPNKIKTLSKLPVSHLSLQQNNIWFFNKEQWQALGEALKATKIISLDVRNNCDWLHDKPFEFMAMQSAIDLPQLVRLYFQEGNTLDEFQKNKINDIIAINHAKFGCLYLLSGANDENSILSLLPNESLWLIVLFILAGTTLKAKGNIQLNVCANRLFNFFNNLPTTQNHRMSLSVNSISAKCN